ncbi:MAG: hypothetical protein A3F30_00040 [Candidatus Levybacteria bacterium RIFCSPHIGHO2_12_FULL_37_12]|nr:MAG: hypothetical protein A3C97_00265 [Candidatus Levybacteria bacterium RIFCSPHIGHO2_02_FULL_37_11]OGH29402.1 MAG: hypothetical protein A3F30_00040 [Candidatus Levybacteria bacterium RIFCSPHIGHO2_12_FULL_37_12]OGH32910.1 MAG: hypothetical protein A2953_02110 [Candidatus Levybacteria bacterium RIFCSPLOWO2_01_FULL_36_54]
MNERIRGIPRKLVEERVKSSDKRMSKNSPTSLARSFWYFCRHKSTRNKIKWRMKNEEMDNSKIIMQ